jgi:hypothetical protein
MIDHPSRTVFPGAVVMPKDRIAALDIVPPENVGREHYRRSPRCPKDRAGAAGVRHADTYGPPIRFTAQAALYLWIGLR